jgi:hypothetical protein
MSGRFPASHAAFLGIALAITGFILWSALSASTSLNNLIVVAPAALLLGVLAVCIVVAALRRPNAEPAPAGALGDLLLLSGFGAFCYALTHIGFDVATFAFVWGGIVLSGGRSLWVPPLYAAVFTLALVKGFGSLFPYPMLTLVL